MSCRSYSNQYVFINSLDVMFLGNLTAERETCGQGSSELSLILLTYFRNLIVPVEFLIFWLSRRIQSSCLRDHLFKVAFIILLLLLMKFNRRICLKFQPTLLLFLQKILNRLVNPTESCIHIKNCLHRCLIPNN